jgi:hypothetical protein
MSFFLGQILNPKTSFFLGRREYAYSTKISNKKFAYLAIAAAVLTTMETPLVAPDASSVLVSSA